MEMRQIDTHPAEGLAISHNEITGELTLTFKNDQTIVLTQRQAENLGAYYQQKRDQELGRVRWEGRPDYYFRPRPPSDRSDDNDLYLHNERTHMQYRVRKADVNGSPCSLISNAARWYYTEHETPHCGEPLAPKGKVLEGITCQLDAYHHGPHEHLDTDYYRITWHSPKDPA